DSDDDVFLMQNAFVRAKVPNPLQVVRDGEEAIGYLQGEGGYSDRHRFPLPVLVLLDLNMPKKSGFEVLQWIRGYPQLQRTTVHVLSTSNRASDVERAFDLHANAYVVKPMGLERLILMVRAMYD